MEVPLPWGPVIPDNGLIRPIAKDRLAYPICVLRTHQRLQCLAKWRHVIHRSSGVMALGVMAHEGHHRWGHRGIA